MAIVYYSAVDGNDSDNGSTWSLAKATLAGAFAIANPGDIIYADSAGTEAASAAINIDAASASLTNPIYVISVDRNDDTYLAGADVTIGSGTSAGINICVSGSLHQSLVFFGVNFSCESTANNTANDINIGTNGSAFYQHLEFVDCSFTIKATSATAQFTIGANGASAALNRKFKFKNCTFTLTNATVAGAIRLGAGHIEFVNLAIAYAGVTKPTTLFISASTSGTPMNVVIRDSDLSGYNTTSGNLLDVTNVTYGNILFRNVKLDTTPTFITGTFATFAASVTAINVDSGDTLNVFEYRDKAGTLTESGSVYAGSGAEFAGSSVSWQIVTTADCTEGTPFRIPLLQRWNDGTSAITATVEFVHDSATALHDRNIWSEVSYTSSASFPIGTVNDNRNDEYVTDASPTNHGAGAATWTGTGGFSNENKQKLSHSFTPAEKCLLELQICVGASSKTLYVDPLIRVA